MITLYNRPNKFSNKSLWTTILVKNKHLLYESLVKYSQKDIKQLNTKFHGIELHHIKYAIGSNQNQETCLDYIACCDLIIGCNIKNDLNALSLSLQDIQKINHKLVDIGIALNPRMDCRIQFGLKYYAHLLLGLNNFQKREHSPTIDALATLWVYYYVKGRRGTEKRQKTPYFDF